MTPIFRQPSLQIWVIDRNPRSFADILLPLHTSIGNGEASPIEIGLMTPDGEYSHIQSCEDIGEGDRALLEKLGEKDGKMRFVNSGLGLS